MEEDVGIVGNVLHVVLPSIATELDQLLEYLNGWPDEAKYGKSEDSYFVA